MADIAMHIATKAFNDATRELEKTAAVNTERFAQTIADAYESTAKANKKWINRRGVAVKGLYGKKIVDGKHIYVEMGGSAKNYKRSTKYPDYMELLEFGHKSKTRNFPDLGIVYPTFAAICSDFRKQYGESVFKGGKYMISRSKLAARQRAKAQRAREKAR